MVDHAARALIKTGCLINPIIVRQTSKDPKQKLLLIDGSFGFYAALRARELDPTLDAVNVFIAQTDAEEAALREQLSFFRSQQPA